MLSFLRDMFGSSSSRRSERESDPYSSSAGYGSSRGDSYSGYGSGQSSRYDSYEPTPTRARSSSSGLGRSASTGSSGIGYAYNSTPYNYRDVSPPRGDERPRTGNLWDYEQRSVSPLGSSRFEQPYTYGRSSGLSRSSSARETRSDPYASSRDGYGFSSRAAYNPDSYQAYGTSYEHNPYQLPSTPGLSRSNPVRGRTAERPTYRSSEDGEYGSRLGTQRRPNIDSNFRSGGFSSWDLF
jgi:hypothetical protein